MCPYTKCSLRRFNLVWLLWILGCAVAGASEPAPESAAWHEAVMTVSVNTQVDSEMLVVLRDAAGALWIDAADFDKLRLRPPVDAGQEYQGHHYLPVAAIPGVEIAVDDSRQSVTLMRSEEHSSELQSQFHLVCRLLL